VGGLVGFVMLYYEHLEDKRDSSDVKKAATQRMSGRVPECEVVKMCGMA
jgi:hypothetical protein